ncbi:peptide MFS transporter [Pseudonocardia acaciae]|uniref:peptide MFS transporter n=1 Tax=Pseudonocardia acaciae TaxID=551276 RepID=UPI00048A7D33|nr:peptide MFS transporter [Pseudonocardia acaciae]
MPDVTDAVERPPERTIFGHPIGLANLFGVELWERFSFYGMQGILTYYLYYTVTDGGLALPQSTATSIVGAYGGAVYLSTVFGAWIADRLVGMERTVLYGGVVVMLGHISLAVVPGLAGVGLGLVLVALGSGALTANITSLVGTLYAEGDTRRDAGFTLYYLGINVGAFVGPLLTGLAQVQLGFHYGFGLAAIGMAVGLAQYVVYRRNLGAAGRAPTNPLPESARVATAAIVLVVAAAVVATLFTGVVTLANLAWVITGVIAAASVVYFAVILASKKVTGVERGRVWAFVPLFIANAVFWTMFQQMFTVLAVYSDERMDWNILGWTAPPTWLQSEEPIWIILLSPVFALIWTKLGTRAPTTPVKFALGVIGMGAAFLLFLPFTGGTGKSTPALAVHGILAVFAISELMLSPIGLSATSKLAPDAFRAQMMALYFFSIGVGSSMAGVLARFYSPTDELAYFGTCGVATIVVGLAVYALKPWISHRMQGVH